MDGLRQWAGSLARRLLTSHSEPTQPLCANLQAQVPPELWTDSQAQITVHLMNQGSEPWLRRGRFRIELQWQWLDYQGERVISSGDRAPLARNVSSGQSSVQHLSVVPPHHVGDYLLKISIRQMNSDESDSSGTAIVVPVKVNVPPKRDCDYVQWYRQENLDRNHWRIVGPQTEDENLQIQQDQLAMLRSLGLGSESAMLDVGCGTGKLAEAMAKEGIRTYTGTDIGREGIEFCRRRITAPGFQFLHQEPTTLPVQNQSFDFIVFFSVLTHTYPDDTRALLHEAVRLLNPNGIIVADVLLSSLVQSYGGRRGAVEISEATFQQILNDVGLTGELIADRSHPWHRYATRGFYRISN